MTATYTSPTAALRCVSAEKAIELADRLVSDCGCAATAAGRWVTAPIDNIGFVFQFAEFAVAQGYAGDSDAMSFQSAGIDLANDRRMSTSTPGSAALPTDPEFIRREGEVMRHVNHVWNELWSGRANEQEHNDAMTALHEIRENGGVRD